MLARSLPTIAIFSTLVALSACRTPSAIVSGGDEDDGIGIGGGVGGGEGSGDDTGGGCEELWYLDGDGDGYGDVEVYECEPPEDGVKQGGDCDDADEDIFPGAEEICNGKDDDCDGEGDPSSCDPVGGHFPAELDLSEADAKLWSSTAGYDAGRQMDVGDVDGDGIGDALISSMWANGYKGGAFVVPGPITESQPLQDAGFWLSGGAGSYEAGRSVSIAEATGDAYGDVYLGSPDAPTTDIAVFFGPITENLAFPGADIVLSCAEPIECGHGGDLVDVSGDGIADLIVGAAEENNGGADSGSLYFIFGPLTATNGVMQEEAQSELRGASAGLETGRKIAAGGDMNGDGIGDLIATATYDSTAGTYAGAVYVAHGPFDEYRNFADVEGKWLGEKAEDYAGEYLAQGDIDGDGLMDAVIGSYLNSRYDGAAYVALGPATGLVSMGDAAIIVRGDDQETLGSSVAAGDIDGDGVDELLIGAGYSDLGGNDSGAAYLFLGLAAGSYTTAQASTTFIGEARGDGAGFGAKVGDLTGDGWAEVLIGATAETTGGSAAGAVYVFDANN